MFNQHLLSNYDKKIFRNKNDYTHHTKYIAFLPYINVVADSVGKVIKNYKLKLV